MGNGSIRSRVRIAIAVLGTGFLALLILVQWTGWQTHNNMVIASQSLFPATLSSQEAVSAFQKLTKSYSDAVLMEDQAGIGKADEAAQGVRNALQSVREKVAFDPVLQKQIAKLMDSFNDLASRSDVAYGKMIQSKGNLPEGVQTSLVALAKDNEQMEESLRDLRSALSKDFQARLDSVSMWSKLQRVLGLVLFLVLACAGVVIAVQAERTVSAPLQQLITRCRQIAGDLIGTGEKTVAGDEIMQLSQSFESLVSHLHEMAAVAETIARGDLSQEVRPRSEHDALGQALARMTEGLMDLVSTVRENAAQVASGSTQVAEASEGSALISTQSSSAIDEVMSTMHEMAANVQNVVRHTKVQTSSIGETSSSIEHMVISIQRVADSSKTLMDISDRSKAEVDKGIERMHRTTDGLNRINDSIQATSGIIDVLGQRAENVGKIIEVIDDLAEQTNLLALNAAIEAARAGEHGLGFAVVAEEIRKLADRSAQSTKEISELIETIQHEARKSVDNMDKSTAIVNEGLSLGKELDDALTKIAAVVKEVNTFARDIGGVTKEQSNGSMQIANATAKLNDITKEINSSVEEQATGTDNVVKAMDRMRELVQQSASGSAELAASSDQMSKMARDLMELMGRFRLRSASEGEWAQKPRSLGGRAGTVGDWKPIIGGPNGVVKLKNGDVLKVLGKSNGSSDGLATLAAFTKGPDRPKRDN